MNKSKKNFSSRKRGNAVFEQNSNHRTGGRPHSGRPAHRGSGNRFGFRRGKSGFKDKNFSDVSKFVNKVSVVKESKAYIPKHAFDDFNIDSKLKINIAKKGYVQPSPIQDGVIQPILDGKDVVGLANTGTGKTGAFLIPLIDKALKDKEQEILIVVPTRELAIQIEEELKSLTVGMPIYSVTCVGGAPIGPQLKALRYRNNFVIGTPGRLRDLINRKSYQLRFVKTIVLDEADRMLDMGFVNEIRFMMEQMPEDKHTLFFSATTSPEIDSLINKFLNNPITISVRTRDTSENIHQDVVRITRGESKIDALDNLLRKTEMEKVLIFGKTKRGVEQLKDTLVQRGFNAESLHGDNPHSKRQRTMRDFKTDKLSILVATDVAARGIDVKGVSHVINYELPATYEDYIHRIGRTGRAGKLGVALTFVDRY